MPISDAILTIHGCGAAMGAISSSGGILGDALCRAASEYSALELDLGAAFPSSVEAGYTFPPEVMGMGGVEFGLHIVVMSAFDTLTSILFDVLTSAATAALYSTASNIIASRTLTLAQLAVAGAHYFIPVPQTAVKRFNRFYAALTGSPTVAGTIVAYYGPRTGGEL
jgi:hypothetical protein